MINSIAESVRTIDVLEGGIDWPSFFADYWLKKPVLIKKPFEQPVMTKEDIFEALKRYQADLAQNKKRQAIVYDRHRSSINGFHTSTRNNLGVHKVLPSPDDRDFDDFNYRMTSSDQYKEFCIYVQDANSDEFLWEKTRELLHTIHDHIPLSPHKATCDLFVGNYAKTNFGAHRDPLNNFMFMVFGSRTMLLWDDEVWFEELGNPRNFTHVVVDYEHFRDAAITVTLEEGDLLYWPVSTWHVGENNGQLSGSFNLDFFSEDMDSDILSDEMLKETLTKAVKGVAREIYVEKQNISEALIKDKAKISLPPSYSQMVSHFMDKLKDKQLDKELTSLWLKKNTSFGQMVPIPKRPGSIQEDSPLVFDKRFPVMYSIIEHNILISHGGHVLVISNHAEIFASVIEKLNQMDRFTPKEFFAQLQFAAINQETVLNLLQQLYSLRALDLAV